MTKKIMVAAVFTMIFSLLIPTLVRADIKLKVAVVNPSSTEKQTTPVKFDLPKGMGPDDVIDAEDMELGYDFEKDTYYVYKMVTLAPSEKKILEVRLRDVWAIPEKKIDFLKKHTGSLEKRLKKTKHFKVGSTLAGRIIERLDKISKTRKKQALGINERINLYYENMGILDEITEDIGMLENLVIDIGGIVEDRVEIPETMAVSVAEEKAGHKKPVELKIKVLNPSKEKEQITSVKYTLPLEVTPRHMVDSDGLDMGYDFSKEGFYVYKSEVPLKPGEEKVFIVKIKDIWRIQEVEIKALDSHTNNLMLLLKETEHYGQGKLIADKIEENLNEITETQALEVEVAKHIAHYRENTVRLDDAQKYVNQLEKIVTQSGYTSGVTIAWAEKLKGGGPQAQRQRGYEGISLIAKSIFKGKAPTVATTWKIIFTILGFVAIVGGTFYALWYIQEQKRAKDKE